MTDELQAIRRRWLGGQVDANANVLGASADIATLLTIIDSHRQLAHNICSAVLGALQPLQEGDITDVDVLLVAIRDVIDAVLTMSAVA